MKFETLVHLTGGLTHFDMHLLVQAFDEGRAAIRVQLSRWLRQGKVIGLRRGFYALPEPYRKVPVSPAELANALYRPAYLSGSWAMGFYGLIPEREAPFTSVTTRPPQQFENPFGTFEYRNIKREAFFGYRAVPDGAAEILVADPEKALLDFWHLSTGEWTAQRLADVQYQNTECVDGTRLERYAARYGSARLERAARRWTRLLQTENEGTVRP